MRRYRLVESDGMCAYYIQIYIEERGYWVNELGYYPGDDALGRAKRDMARRVGIDPGDVTIEDPRMEFRKCLPGDLGL